MGSVHVTDGKYPGILVAQKGAQMFPAHAADTDEAQRNAFARRRASAGLY